MIISPPFLPDVDVNQSTADETWVGAMMSHTGDGKFPVSDYLQWHGGIHLVAPEGNNKTKVPVRAIADGKILYVRQPTPEPDNKAGTVPHPQNHQGQEDWCDNGCVVIQHDTEIGEDLPVTFYSIYMHLKSIEATVIKGSDIHRKGKIGQAGQIYGIDGQIHFEIIADEANTKKFIGDLAFSAPNYHINQYGCEQAFRAQNGRTDACFGSMYFYIPQGTPIYTKRQVKIQKQVGYEKEKYSFNKQDELVKNPLTNLPMVKITSTHGRDGDYYRTTTYNEKGDIDTDKLEYHYIDQNGNGNGYGYNEFDADEVLSPPEYNAKGIIQNAYKPQGTIGQAIYLEMKLEKGKCIFIAYDESGTKKVIDGSEQNDDINEYNFYKKSLERYHRKPTAGFELMRFGRVLGDETLEVEDMNNFRLVPTPKGYAYVDLSKSYVKKYSDADFPYWKGWGISNDDNDGDGRCDSAIIQQIIYKYWVKNSPLANNVAINVKDTEKYINNAIHSYNKQHTTASQTKDIKINPEDFTRKIYQFKTGSDIIKMAASPEVQESIGSLSRIFYKFPTEWSMDKFDKRYAWVKKDAFLNDDKKFANFKAHAQSLAFWDEAGIPIDKNHWHFPPIEFIKHFRKCSWLSYNEMKQLLPSKNIDDKGATGPVIFYENQDSIFSSLYININKALQKYCINTPLRMACFFGNALEETIWVETLSQRGDFSNPWNRGRGMLQLTFEGNYKAYWNFRNITVTKDQEELYRNMVATSSLSDPIDSAGFYWAQLSAYRKTMYEYADKIEEHQLIRVGTSNTLYFRSLAFWNVSAGVNGPRHITTPYHGINGFPSRCCAYVNCLAVLTEKKFPNADNKFIDDFPESYKQRDINEKNKGARPVRRSRHHR